MAFYIRQTGTQICRGFKVRDLITCKSKVQSVVSLGRHWVLTNGTWHVLLQSGNVLELGGITKMFDPLIWDSTNYVLQFKLNSFLPWQHTGFQTSPILKAFLATFGVLFSYLQIVPYTHDPIVPCHAFCMWHWPIGKDLDLKFIWGHHRLSEYMDISRPAEYFIACYTVLTRPNKVETAVHGCNCWLSV